MSPDEWREQIGARVEQRREQQGISIEAASRFAGVSRTWWRQLESGRNNAGKTPSPKPSSLAGASRAIGWAPDSIARMMRGLEPIEATPAVTASAPSGDVLAQILQEVRDHRMSDIAPISRLGELATKEEVRQAVEEVRQEVAALRTELTEQRYDVAETRGAEIDALVELVGLVNTKVDQVAAAVAVQKPPPAAAAGRPAKKRSPSGDVGFRRPKPRSVGAAPRRIDTRATRTGRNAK